MTTPFHLSQSEQQSQWVIFRWRRSSDWSSSITSIKCFMTNSFYHHHWWREGLESRQARRMRLESSCVICSDTGNICWLFNPLLLTLPPTGGWQPVFITDNWISGTFSPRHQGGDSFVSLSFRKLRFSLSRPETSRHFADHEESN